MVKNIKECSVDKINGLKDGNGITTVINIHEKEDFNEKGRLYGVSIIEVGGSIGYHTHDGDQETYFILEGKGEYNDNGKICVIGPGDVTICKNGDSHGLKNIGDVDLRYMALILYA